MKEFVCTAKKANGDLIRNYRVRAEDETALVNQLKAEKLFLVAYKLKEEEKDILGG